MDALKVKEKFFNDRDKIFNDESLLKDPFSFCVKWSLVVEEYIQKVLKGIKLDCAIASVGSFSRRELSPYSDIDIMFIYDKLDGEEQVIKECVTLLWDAGIEVSSTVREFSDIQKFQAEDLHAFTQFIETRYILGNEKLYHKWNKKVFESVTEKSQHKLISDFFEDVKKRHDKFGDSAKVLEPNVKFTAGGLRDLQVVEWIYSLRNNLLLTSQEEITQTQNFLANIKKDQVLIPRAVARLQESYRQILNTRNHLHLLSGRKNDRLEFIYQEKIANVMGYTGDGWHNYMRKYFEAANIIKRFLVATVKRYEEELNPPLSNFLFIELDDDFSLKGKCIYLRHEKKLSLSTILRVYYYRGFYDARLEENLRSQIIEAVIDHEDTQQFEPQSSVFFREILRLPRNVGKTLNAMNELGVLGAFLPEFKEIIGFFQPGVYHCYTADEHTLIALNNVEKLADETSVLGKLFQGMYQKDVLFLAILFHDIAKPISLSGHEIIGAEIANSIMERLGYGYEEIETVQFLVRHHLTMEQVAFRRNLNDPSTLNSFAALFTNSELLDLLYLVTYADLSAVSQVVWTQWKSDLLNELYSKTKTMIDNRISGHDLLSLNLKEIINGSELYSENSFKEHLESINDLSYLKHFSTEEINRHIEEIEKGVPVSVFFKEEGTFTVVTIITRDSEALLSRICGALSINDLSIHDAKIFTRKDGIVISIRLLMCILRTGLAFYIRSLKK